ncbi:hypothetical protein AB0442_12330 [Kitasatospora sp. NPDC085895]|uniref:hypothetical protein n=1 Tax=Kitasatospora sp. NPDC085895 TaxID=3155057 RepID=UPI00344BE60D
MTTDKNHDTGGTGGTSEGPLVTMGVTAGPGGVMTVEVGVITGDLTLRTTRQGNQAVLEIQYDDADEWCTVQGSPTDIPAGKKLQTVHQAVIDAIKKGGGATAPN